MAFALVTFPVSGIHHPFTKAPPARHLALLASLAKGQPTKGNPT